MTGKREQLRIEIERAVAQWCDAPFAWHDGDCLTSLADIVKAARGYDFAWRFRGRYKTRIGALRVTQPFGGIVGALEAAADERGWREIEPRAALVGDLGIVLQPCFSAALFAGRFWLARGQAGAAGVTTDRIARAWRVT